jgi:hypothetical protein
LHVARQIDSRQRWARRRNVLVLWLHLEKTPQTAATIHAALSNLRYSPTEAARQFRPAIELHPGESRTVDMASYPRGTIVSCVSGSLRVEEFLSEGPWTDNFDSNKTEELTLSRSAPAGSHRTYSCHARHVNRSSSSQGTIRNPKSCKPGPRTVRLAGVVARIPRGWYAATVPKHDLFVGNRRRCAVNWPTSTHGIYLMISVFREPGRLPRRPGKALSRFTILHKVKAEGGYLPGAYSALVFSRHRGYDLEVQMGVAARKLHGLRRARFILRGVKLPPSITLPGG